MSVRILLVFFLLFVWAAASGCDNSTPAVTCTGYGDFRESPYILPYPVGETYEVVQGNCSSGEGRWNSHQPDGPWMYAYDFLMPIGSRITAARGGTVVVVEESFNDNNRAREQGNLVIIQHVDGTYATYGHLTNNGAVVAVGDQVDQGDLIGLSGNSGASPAPHLHFDTSRCLYTESCGTLPVTFRNARPHPDGLVQGESYEAYAWDVSAD